MLIVNALAGTGKTTVACHGLGKPVPKDISLSDEQKDIVRAMRAMKWESAAAQAFNTTIANELKERVPAGVEAATCNAFGHRAWLKHIGRGFMKPDGWKTGKVFKELYPDMPYQRRRELEGDVCKLVNLSKNFFVEPTRENLEMLADRFDLELTDEIADYVRLVYEESIRVGDKLIDFDDQVFLPIYHNLKVRQFDMVVVDELQDLNTIKQMFAFKMARKYVVGIGDVRQAIYGFAGSDSEAMLSFKTKMKEYVDAGGALGQAGFKELPLTMTRRCPKAVVKVANKYVPELRATDDAPEGEVLTTTEEFFTDELCADTNGRMVLCRTNAPLTSLAFSLISRDRRCFIQGKDIGEGLIAEVRRTKEEDISSAVDKVQESLDKRIEKLNKSEFVDQSKIDSLVDKKACITYLSQGCSSVEDYCTRVSNLFKDKGAPGDVQLSSVHKSKGLEHRHVCIYKPSKLPMTFQPSKKGKSMPKFQQEQEKNLAYVAYTRSMNTLTFVVEPKKLK